jgi:uncharacterized RDD family membrane protein YckC
MANSGTAVPSEARPHHGQPAGLVSRTIAAVVDWAVVVVLLVLGYAAIAIAIFALDPRSFQFPDPRLVLGLLGFLVLLVVYWTLSWWLSGRSYGAHLMGLRVVDRRGSRLRLVVALVRAVACAVLPIGLVWAAVSARRKSLQDIVCGTSVVYDWR